MKKGARTLTTLGYNARTKSCLPFSIQILILRFGQQGICEYDARESFELLYSIHGRACNVMNKIKKSSFTSLIIVFTLASICGFFNRASAVETEVFFDGFELGVANWSLGTGWSVVSEYGNNVLQGTQHNFAIAYVEGVADKLEFKLKLLNGAIHVNIRSSSAPEGLNRYYIGFSDDFSNIGKQLDDNFQGLESGPGISLNVWYDIKI